jgi:hypothetical protein
MGVLALAVPLWLHLRRRHPRNLLRFSVLRFLDDQPRPRRTPMRLTDLLLLGIRSLALVCLVAGFAWPYVHPKNSAPLKESRVYILDNTLSHQANDGFNRDRDRIVKELSRAGRDVQVAVVELTSAPRIVVSFSDDRQAAAQKVQSMTASFERGSYLAAFRQANALLDNSLGSEKRLIFLGDNQENQWTESANMPPFLHDVQVELPKSPAQRLPNLWLAEPRAQRIFLGEKSMVNFSVKLGHIGGAKSARLVVRANGQVISNREVDLDGQPETILLPSQWEGDAAATLRGEAVIEGAPDALAADNRVFFSLPPVVEGKVALLAQSPYLRLALSPEIMRGQWAARVLEPSGLNAELAANNDADVLVIESGYLQSAGGRKLLHRYLDNGRGVLLLINRLSPAIKGCLRELGFEAEGIVKPVRAEKFRFVLSNHPVFHPFASPDFGNLMDIEVSQYAQLKTSQALPLICSEAGAGLFFQAAPGSLLVVAFGLDREHTSWAVHPTFIPFLDLALQSARAEDSTPTTFEPGETALVQLPADTKVREVILRERGREVGRAQIKQSGALPSPTFSSPTFCRTSSTRAELRLPDHPGLFDLTYDDGTEIQKIFSINPSPKESQLAFCDPPDGLNGWHLSTSVARLESAATSGRPGSALGAILQQRLWWWMLLAGLAALALEMVLAGTTKERV